MKEYKVGIPTYYTKYHIDGMRFLLNNLNGVEFVREELTDSCVANEKEIAIYVKLADEYVLQCLQTLVDCEAFTLCPVSVEQTSLF